MGSDTGQWEIKIAGRRDVNDLTGWHQDLENQLCQHVEQYYFMHACLEYNSHVWFSLKNLFQMD